ncbi:hypothetical protein A3C23_05365 [Candidatus Roizmanbacteria bacterium RIFCSPHIGHO2_02_FULL_37_13b]|uniref:Large ribosomal subunit protein uL29 n=1 Tax=Candidatus Roizmanbacteria bacterium RIFCSPLOWO2_02_FULL_36_11 TaxID=1802071 RepID=A0A1F7JCI5_9BACT|nr:MAG: hypothetical protein A3C23_05365 [Candidatus Roizmanbacteria bacterium RIFCSPHIGHO2_02_FULL_37_13b]OGK53328.1 MAG: hypothetical protein A3H78_03425 [Candidatus Roizmanbacteria bacterium RIFCSPLOWO2_02_FULL_36_11]
MKKSELQQLKGKQSQDLDIKVEELRRKINMSQLDNKVNPPKDSNSLSKLKKTLAQILTIRSEKGLKKGQV